MSENIPITFAWRRQLQEADWPERKRKSVMAVAFILEDYADPDGQNVYPANDTIAFKAGMNIKTVRDVLRLMTENRFLRRVGKARYGQSKYRLIYPALPIETYLQRPTNSEKSKTPTNRTELPTAHSSPKGDIVAPSANTERSVSVPKVQDDLVVVERIENKPASANSNLGKVTARAKSVITKSQAQIDAENHRIRTEVDQILESHVEGFHGYNGFYVVWEFKDPDAIEIFSLVYNDCNLFSHFCKTVQCFDRRQWHLVADEMQLGRFIPTERKDSIRVFLTDTSRRAFVALIDGIKRHRFSKRFLTQVAEQDLEVSDLNLLTINEIHSRFYRVSDSIVKEIREIQNRQHLHRLRKVDAEIFRSATNTGSDRMIVEKIVETVSEKVEVKGLERW